MDIQLIMAMASVITGIGTISAVVVAVLSIQADHERKKKQATIEAYDQISNTATLPLWIALRETYGEDYSTKNIDEDIKNVDKKLKDIFLLYCRKMERFSVGIDINVYDFDTFYRLSGESTAELFKNIEPLIKRQRKKTDISFCDEFINLNKKILKEQNLPKMNKKGKIKNLLIKELFNEEEN